jgi:DNA-binding response OmpR family regulator
MSNKILLVEDDILLSESIEDLLEDEGYKVTTATNGENALDYTYKEKFDLYLLDINIPLINGLEVLKSLREANDNTPAIFLTSHKEKEKLKEGFLSGGDDYITKPFDNDELLLRIEALLRRVKPKNDFIVGDYVLKTKQMCILYKNQELKLSKKEYELLSLFLQNTNQLIPKELIIDELWSNTQTGSDGAIRVYINRIKQLIPEINIENIRGIGYKFVLQS